MKYAWYGKLQPKRFVNVDQNKIFKADIEAVRNATTREATTMTTIGTAKNNSTLL